MFRNRLLRGASSGALALACVLTTQSTVLAQQSLPTIEVGGARRAPATHHSHHAGPGPSAPRLSTPAPSAPSPVVAQAPAPAPVSVWSPTLPDGKPAFVQRFQLPNTVASVTRRDIQDKVNIIDTEDAVKYMPSLSMRKRNNGETQAVLQTRTWGYGSSARSLVYADDLLLTALIGNDNSIGAPRWGLVSPEEIERIDFLYGPFSAAYPGNSLGGVLQITTRMPQKLEMTAKQTVALQDFSLYGTSKLFHTEVTSATIGDKVGNFSWFFAGNYAHGTTQPLSYVTASSGTFPWATAATSPNLFPYPGAYFATTRYGVPATVLGSGGNLENDQVNAKLKLAYDITPTVRASYILGFWSNDGTSIPENYLAGGRRELFGPATGAVAIGQQALSGFASGYYRVQEKMLTNAAAIKSNTGGVFDWEVSASHFTYLQSDQRTPSSALASTAANPFGGYTRNGRDSRLNGTYWTLLDLKGIVRPEGFLQGHDISFGLHGDHFHLNNPVWLTTSWTAGQAASYGVALSSAKGTTRTQALWIQDAWRLHPNFKFTVGVRGEHWQASDGYNQQLPGLNALQTSWGPTYPRNATPSQRLAVDAAYQKSTLPIIQPNLYHTRFSPKGSLQWTPDNYWTVTGSIGMANRFPTTRELYNLNVAPGTGTVVNPNPNLRAEVALSKELAVERRIGPDGSVRVSLFDDEVRDAIISKNTFTPTGQLAQTPVNVERIRLSGVEVAARKDNVLFKGLELTASATFLNARVISDPKWIPAGGNNLDQWALRVDGKTVPNVPDWRWTATATYRPDDHWAFTVAARWQGRMWSTLANNEIAHGVYQNFDRFFVVDAKVRYKWNERLSFDAGIDNIGNYKYMLFHPFPQRTFYLSGKYEFGTDPKGAPGIFFTGNEAGLPNLASWFQPAAFTID